MKVEFLYPELTNLLGENGSQMLLTSIFGQENVLRTPYPNTPRFLKENIKLVYMGAMTEAKQELILDLLLPLKDGIMDKINRGQFIFFAGNSLDILGKRIIHEDGPTLEGLGLFNFETRVNKYDRINKFVHGHTRAGSEIFGWISQFTNYHGTMPAFIETPSQSYGVNYKNLYASSLLGPLLITSPIFTKELLSQMGMDTRLPMEEELLTSFEKRREHMLKNTE